MFESDIVWIEFIVQVSLAVPVCTIMSRLLCFRKIGTNIPDWLPISLIYCTWKVINEVMLRYPEMLSDNLSIVMTYRAIIGLTIMIFIVPWFCRGSLLKRYFQFFLTELMSVISFICRAGCMVLLRVSGVYHILERAPFILLAVRIIIEWFPYYLLLWIFRKPIRQYHDNEIKRRKICSIVVVIQLGLEISSALLGANAVFLANWRFITGAVVVCTWFVVSIYFQQKENERILLQKKLMENHYHSVKNQAEQMGHVHKDVGRLLESVEQLGDKTDLYAENIKGYEEELKKIYQQLRKIDYCDNIVIDAVLHSKVKECEEKGIDLTVEMQDMNLGALSEIDVFEIIYEMLDLVICCAKEKNKRERWAVAIKTKNIAGQLILGVSYPEAGYKERNLAKRFRRIKKKAQRLGGHCSKGMDNGKEMIIAGIPCE